MLLPPLVDDTAYFVRRGRN